MEVFERSDLTYTNTGRRDHVYNGKVNGEKQSVQKGYLLWSLSDALETINGVAGFKDEFGESLSFTQFYRFIKGKKQITLQKDIPETSCLCEICENVSLMAKAVRKRKNAHPTTPTISWKDIHVIPRTYALQMIALNANQKRFLNHGMPALMNRKATVTVMKKLTHLPSRHGHAKTKK